MAATAGILTRLGTRRYHYRVEIFELKRRAVAIIVVSIGMLILAGVVLLVLTHRHSG